MENLSHPFKLCAPDSEEEWTQAELLIAELKEWDAQQCQVLGFDRDDVWSTFYPDSLAGHSPKCDSLLPTDASCLPSMQAHRWAVRPSVV